MKTPKPSQLAVIREVERHLLVNAGAGTGKTTTIVNKILYLLGAEIDGMRVSEPLRLADIAAITYTNRAAADLKRKLRDALHEVGAVEASLRDAAYEVDVARIGTIHAFCGDVLREFALRGGYEPPSRVLEEGEAIALQAECVRDAVIGAIDRGGIDGLDALLAVYSLRDVETWVSNLAVDADRWRRLSAGPHDGHERVLLSLAREAIELKQARLETLGAVDFDAMIVLTRDLIRDHRDVREALQRRIRLLVVDEFQDVDPVQKEIAYLLGDPHAGRADTPRLLLVGDPKQSIYRFRRADVTVWRGVQEDFERRGCGRVLPLSENFRSVAPLLAFVDVTVGASLDEPQDGTARQPFEVDYLPVEPAREDAACDGRVELHVVSANDAGKQRRAEEIRAADALGVARRMLELHAEGVAWKDMAVLLSAWAEADRFERVLRSAGIPTYTLRGDGFLERREVLDMILALELARDPEDRRALFGFLRSPFVGVRDDTLLHLARARMDVNAAPLSEEERARVERGLAVVARYERLRDRAPAADLLRALMHETGYLAHLALLPDGDRAAANVRQFLRMANASRDATVGDFLRAIAERRSREDRVEEARLYGEHDDVVTISSVHMAKGLEWRVVFWCDLIREPQLEKDRLVIGRDRILLGEPELHAKEQPAEWQQLRAQENLEKAAEQKRLRYVAATRAMDRLIVSGVPLGTVRNPDTVAKLVRAALPQLESGEDVSYVGADGREYHALVRELEVPEGEDVAGAVEVPSPAQVAALPVDLPPVRVPVGRARHSATALMQHQRCERRHWFRYVAGVREPELARRGRSAREAFERALVRGQITHDVLAEIEELEDVELLLEEAIGRWAEDAPPPESPRGRRYRESLREEIEATYAHAEYRELADVPGARRELPFMLIGDGGVCFEGAIDLAAPGAEADRLLDVKTGAISAAEAEARAEKYRLQAELYAVAVEAIAGRRVGDFHFFFSGPLTRVTPVLRAREEVALDLSGRVREIGVGRPRLASDASECRGCGFRRDGWCAGVRASPRGVPADRKGAATAVQADLFLDT